MRFLDWLGGRGRAICADCEHQRTIKLGELVNGDPHLWDACICPALVSKPVRHPVTGKTKDGLVDCWCSNRDGRCKYFQPTLASTAIRPTRPIPPPPPMPKRCCAQCKTKPRKVGDWLCAACIKKLRYHGHNGPPPPDDWPKPKPPPAPPPPNVSSTTGKAWNQANA